MRWDPDDHYYVLGIFVGEVVVVFSSAFCFLVERRSRLEVSLSRLPTCRQRSHGANPQWWVCVMSTHFHWVTTSTTNYSFKIGKCLHLPCQKGAIIIMTINTNRDDEDDENMISKILRTTTGSWRTMESSTNCNFSLPTVSFLLFFFTFLERSLSALRKFCRSHFGLNSWKVSWSSEGSKCCQ